MYSVLGSSNVEPLELYSLGRTQYFMMLLGNPISAITQFGDLPFALYHSGKTNGMRGLLEALSRGKGDKIIDRLSLDSPMLEYSTKSSSVWLDKVLEKTGFKWVDLFGKETFLQSAYLKYQNMGIEEFTKRWEETGEMFDFDMEKRLYKALKMVC